MSGFIKMQRGWREHHMFRGEFSRADAWLWMIEQAAWKPTRTRIKGQTVDLDRGELSFSVRFMADQWGWSKSRVDRFLADLREESMIETRSKIGTACDHKAGQGQSIISICNYSKYQDVGEADWDKRGTTSGTSAGQQRDKEEEGKKGRSILTPYGVRGESAENFSEQGKVDLLGDPVDIDDGLKPDHVVEVWNSLAKRIGRPRVLKLTPERRQQLKARIAGYTIDQFTEAVIKVEASSFLRGDRNWKGITFDWFIKKANFLKILEGNYDD